MTRPQPGLVLGSCTITEVVDGDTVEVEIRRRVRVRITDCWGPEKKRTSHPTEKARGLEAKAKAEQLFPVGSPVTLKVDSDGDCDLGDQITFGRCLGDLWRDDNPEDGASFGEHMNASGHTFRTKAELEASLEESDHALAMENYNAL